MEMGMDFTEEQVIRALQASSDNPDYAVELLLSGAGLQGSENVSVSSPPQSSHNLSFLANRPNSTPSAIASIPGFPQGSHHLMQQQQPEQQRQSRRDSSSMSLDSMGGSGGMGGLAALAGMAGISGPGEGGGAVPIEIDAAQVRAIRRMVAENPILTGPLIESLRVTDPVGAAELSVDDPEGILHYFDQIGRGESGQGPPARAHA